MLRDKIALGTNDKSTKRELLKKDNQGRNHKYMPCCRDFRQTIQRNFYSQFGSTEDRKRD